MGICVLASLPTDARDEAATSKGGLPFGPTEVWSVVLEMTPQEFDAMQPPVPGFPAAGGFPPPPGNQERPRERNFFGTEFPWARADVNVNGDRRNGVGVRYAGGITYFVSAQRSKRPLWIQFDRFGSDPFHGLSSLQLQAMPLDPSQSRQVLASAVFRSLGVATPRTAYADVTLAVPGRLERVSLGLYAVVEGVGDAFLAEQLGTNRGLLMSPVGIRSVDFLGNDWKTYRDAYRPQREATREESERIMEFARLVHRANDEEFAENVADYLEIDGFLRFLAANALSSNLESVFALGHNYHLYLHPQTNQLVFLPGDLEFSFANFLLMGTAEQLMDLSLTRPYPGENRLVERLLAMPEVRAKYLRLLEEILATVFTKENLLGQIDAIEQATKSARDRDLRAAAARREPPVPPAPQAPPDLRTFIERRLASVSAQLSGARQGYVPQPLPLMIPPGPPGGGGRTREPAESGEAALRADVNLPGEFAFTIFAAPPRVNYPVALAATPDGDLFVAVDEQGSLGRAPGGGKVLFCRDRDRDGRVDDVTEFAKVEHPRGICYRDGSTWVMHPPTLSVFHDDDGDGVADRHRVLVTGLTTDLISTRGGDHTTNCVRLGIDGWLYIGVGDYGIERAEGSDGRTISLRGGGVVRVRPDGTELEIFCTGLRNPFDLAIDPFLNLFTRDNTNDGGGWDVRVSHLFQTAEYGYPRLFVNFPDESMPPLGTYAGGGGTGALFVQDPSWPEPFCRTLLTGDWGRSEVYRHELRPHGPTFDLQQDVFLKIPRVTGMDLDGSGRLFVASWRGGEAAVHVGPNVGFIVQVTPKAFVPRPFPDLKRLETSAVVALLASPQAVVRLHAQGELLRRGRSADATALLTALAADSSLLLEGRVAAIFTLKQLEGKDSAPVLLKFLQDDDVREFALRALTDRLTELDGLAIEPFLAALQDASPRVRAQAVISLARLNNRSAASSILSLTKFPPLPEKHPVQNQPDPDRVIPHLAVRALVSLRAIEECLEALDGPYAAGSLLALRSMHEPRVVEGLIQKLADARSVELRGELLIALIRLYHREADYDGSWWGIRPDTTGPYFDRRTWDLSARIADVLTAAMLDADETLAARLRRELIRHQVALPALPQTIQPSANDSDSPLEVPKADPNDPRQIGNLTLDVAAQRALAVTGSAERGAALFRSQACFACHTTTDGQTPKGPHLADIGKRHQVEGLVESILQPSAKIAQGFETYVFETVDGKIFSGFVVGERADATLIRESNGVYRELKKADIEARRPQMISSMPEGLVSNLTPEQLADLVAYLQSLR
jgi:putative membrane-bound dehydrogenase-like protein